MLGKVEICGIDTSTLPVIRGEAAREMLARAHTFCGSLLLP